MIANGVIANLSRELYDAEQRAHWSTLKLLGKSPAHYRHALLGQYEDTDARKLGRAVHLAVLEPERFRAECVTWTEGRRAGKLWEAFKAKYAGRELLTEKEHELCQVLQAAVRGNAAAAGYLAGGKGEVSLFWTHVAPALGALDGYEVQCKGRVDFLAERGFLVDLKTTRDASPDGFARECARYSYHAQAAFYSDGYFAATGLRLPYVIVAVESSAPHVVQTYRLPERLIDAGREQYRALLDRLNYCRSHSEYPGYVEGEVELDLPKWAPGSSAGDEDVTGLGLDFGEVAAG